jgi:hypothetical protein
MSIHLFFAVLTVVALVLGATLHSWVVASNTIDSKLNGIENYQQYAKKFLPVIMFRFALSWALFLFYSSNAAAICSIIGAKVSSLSWLQAHPIYASPTIALVYGLFIDSFLTPLATLLGRVIPGLKVDIPPPPGQVQVIPNPKDLDPVLKP